MRTVAHHTLPKAAKRGKKVVRPVAAKPAVTRQEKQKIVLFSLDQLRFALPLSDVVKVERAVEFTPAPKAPPSVSGFIDFHGDIIPVLDLRKLFGLPPREIRLEDQLIVVRTSQRLVVLVADSVAGVYDRDGNDGGAAGGPLPSTKHLSGIATIDHEIVLITDLESLCSLNNDEQRVPDVAPAGREQ